PPPIMRISRSRRSALSRVAVISTLAFPSLAASLDFTTVSNPDIDFSNLGRVGIAGDFSGISVYEYEGQSEKPFSTNGSESILAQLPNGVFKSLLNSDASVKAMCQLPDSTTVVLGGDFTSLGGNQTHGLALLNTDTQSITPLDGLNGQVNSLLCNTDGTVYIGGNFKANDSINALTWSQSGGFKSLEFAGFNGPVNAIVKTSNDHIIFGGSFTGLGNTSLPTELDGQAINLSTANLTTTGTTSDSSYSNPSNIVCNTNDSSSGGWLLQNNTPGSWEAQLGFTFWPTKLRLWNTDVDGRGTKTWRFTALPLNGILNMTYIDSSTGQNISCTSECPLSSNSSEMYQDFHFVNTIGMNSFRIDISAWYGSGGGLRGIELFQDDISSYAVNSFNEPSCIVSTNTASKSTTTGTWSVVPSGQSESEYLSTFLNGTISSSDASVTFYPDIRETGNYTVNIYTPGCIQDNTCSTRGQVNISGIMTSSGETTFSTSLYQTNNFDKYDQVYFGYIDTSSTDFRPSVTITALDGQSISEQTLVAQRVGFILINSTGGLNGLYDYNPKSTVAQLKDFESSAINKLGSNFDSGSAVSALVVNGDTLFASGNFSSATMKNIVAINTSSDDILNPNRGLNGEVVSMQIEDKLLYAGGSFTDTNSGDVQGLSNVGAFDLSSNTWSALGAGVNGAVSHVVAMDINLDTGSTESVIAFSGSFNQCLAFDTYHATQVDGLAVWVPAEKNWIQNLFGYPRYSGVITASANNIKDIGSLVAGSVSSSSIGASGAATFTSGNLGAFSVHILNGTSSTSTSTNLTKRSDSTNSVQNSGVVTGAFYSSSSRNLTVLAGHFTALSPNGSSVQNLAIIDGGNNDTVSGLGDSIDASSAYKSVAITSNLLFAGGSISGSVGGSKIAGIISYDLSASSFTSTQPPALVGPNNTVSCIAVRPNTQQVYVGGSFSLAGTLPCPGVCMWDAKALQWNQPGITLQGSASAMFWNSDNTLLVGGSLQVNGTTNTSIAIYNAKSSSWNVFADADSTLPGPVTSMTSGSDDSSQVWAAGYSSADGSIFLMKWDGSEWISTSPTDLEAGSSITSLQVFATTSKHQGTSALSDKQVLIITGNINLRGSGSVSAVVFDGTTFSPYLLTQGVNNNAGSISHIFVETSNFFKSSSSHMRLVFVVLISLAISLGLVLIIVAAGVLLDHMRKKREGYAPAPTNMADRGSGLQRIPPHQLLEFLERGQPNTPRV
ncbi:hypothetical protein TD95_005312, partial [Thielaviopsis punctulata]